MSNLNKTLLKKVFDYHFRMLAFRGAYGKPPRRLRVYGISPVPLLPQESSIFRSNQFLKLSFVCL